MNYIVVPLDGSELAERAVPFAADLTQLTGWDLKLIQAAFNPATSEVGINVEALLAAGRDYLEELAEGARQHCSSRISVRAAIAPAVHLILEEAHLPDAGALVMSTHGRTGLLRLLMGSVAEGVLRHSPVPVYLLPAAPEMPPQLRLRHVLVPLDGSDLAYTVMGPVAELAHRSGAEITLLRAFDSSEDAKRLAPDYFRPLKARLRTEGLIVNSEWRFGQPASQILQVAERLGADLIALATHGRSGLARLRYGSVAEAVLRHSQTPVMTFGPEAIRRLARDVDSLTDRRDLAVV